MKKFIEEFKAFAVKGNVVDMAVGIVIGGAFSSIVTSLVKNIIMPTVSLLTGKVNLAELSYTLPIGETAEGQHIVLSYGAFLQSVVDFVLIAFSIFCVIKFISRFHKKQEEIPAPAEDPVPSNEEILLEEIRDILKNK
ncbi:MAG: large-conductance mechanosensitive channel protein MscL [Bacillota bacterium]|nr:large-conductance mechanosensitive channel protein MscL [Bacillota bacterium]